MNKKRREINFIFKNKIGGDLYYYILYSVLKFKLIPSLL